MNLRDQILGATDLKTASVEIEQWGLEVPIREFTAAERDKVVKLHTDEEAFNAALQTIVIGSVDENGEGLFSESDVEALSEKSDAAITKLYTEIIKLNGLSSSQEESGPGKPSETIQSSGESTDSCTSLESDATQS